MEKQIKASLQMKGYTIIPHVLMDHMEQLELHHEELMLILFIIRLQSKPPKLYIESLTALAKALRVDRKTLYRWLEALEQPLEAPDGTLLRPTYLHQEESAVGIRYSLNGLIDHLQEILVVCGCEDCVKQRKSRIPHFKSVEEEAVFWDSHDSTEFEDEFVEVDDVQFVKSAPKKAAGGANAA